MTIKGVIAIVLFTLTITGYVLLAIVVVPFGTIAAVLFTVVLSVGAIILKPFRDRLEIFVGENIGVKQSKCRVLIYGLHRSGKTSLSKRILTNSKLSVEKSTPEFNVYEERLKLELKTSKTYNVAFADYKGQKPSQITVDPPESFFGSPDQRLVNAIFFVVDLFPEMKDDEGNPYTDEELMKRYETDTLRRITTRIKSNVDYINEWAIEQVFTVAHSEHNLLAVRLLITKMDLFRELVKRNYVSEDARRNTEGYVRNLYSSLEKNIREACKVNKITDFSVQLISAITGENVDSMFGEILEIYSRKAK